MTEHRLTYFVSDVHLGLAVNEPAEREMRFVSFLRSLPQNTESLYLLGDIWDFWYEYKDVVPRGYVRVLGAIVDLIDRGVNVYFFQGNHDVWTYSYFEDLGMKRLNQPYLVEIQGKTFCLGHGDGLGPVPLGYKVIRSVFHSRVAQFLFSLLHPWIAYRLGTGWSKENRLSHDKTYKFKGEDEPLYKFAVQYSQSHKVDHFIFGHYHDDVDIQLPGGSRLHVLKDWLTCSPYICFDGDRLVKLF